MPGRLSDWSRTTDLTHMDIRSKRWHDVALRGSLWSLEHSSCCVGKRHSVPPECSVTPDEVQLPWDRSATRDNQNC